jgi:dihydroxyacetone kinase
MTSIDMAGASVSIMKLDDEIEELLHEPCDTSALQIAGKVPQVGAITVDNTHAGDVILDYSSIEIGSPIIVDGKFTLSNIEFIIDAMSVCIIKNEQQFCELDSHAGDGDFGMSIAKGFRMLKSKWKAIVGRKDLDIGCFFDECALVIMEFCGGASGPIWGSAFWAAGKEATGKNELTVKEFAIVLESALKGIKLTGKRSFGRAADVGDKTLVDAFSPCVDIWMSAQDGDDIKVIFRRAAQAACAGAKSTESIVARMGRASTVGERSLGYPDAGAYALGVIFTYISKLLV